MTLLVKASIDDQIRRIADQFAPELKAAFLNAVEQLRRTINVGELADLIDSGAIAEMLAGLENVRVDASDVREALRRAAAGTGELVAGEFGLSFDMVNQRAVRWASDHAATLVTGIDTETMLGIRSIITQGQVQGITPRQQAQQIRRIVGLTKRDANAVSRFYEGLLPKVGFRMATDQAERYSNRLLRRRAENIARTETMTAANRGVQFGWTQAQEQGLLPAGTMKVWIATPDERTCPICAVLDGNVIDLAGSWRVDTQATAFTEQDGEFTVAETTPLARPVTTLTPPAHPSCRCTQGIDTVVAPSTAVPPSDMTPMQAEVQRLNNVPSFTDARERARWQQEYLDAAWDDPVRRETIDKITTGAQGWSSNPSRIRAEVNQALLTGTPPQSPPARAIFDIMQDLPPTEQTLYRGIRVPRTTPDMFAQARATLVPGAQWDMPVSSFADTAQRAEAFAAKIPVGDDALKVRYRTKGATRSFHMDPFSGTMEQEWLSGGRWRTVAAREIERDVWEVVIEQVQPITLGVGTPAAAEVLAPVAWLDDMASSGTRIKYSAKRHEKTLVSAISRIDETVTHPKLRARLQKAIQNLDEFETLSDTNKGKRTKWAGRFKHREHGQFQTVNGKREYVPTGTHRKIELQMRTTDPKKLQEWNDTVSLYNMRERSLSAEKLMLNRQGVPRDAPEWVDLNERIADHLSKRPKKGSIGFTVDRPADELAEILLHEASHAMDESMDFVFSSEVVSDGILEEFRRIARSGTPEAKSFSYGAEMGLGGGKGHETFAEIVRFYHFGSGVMSGQVVQTAAEWRAANPTIVEWFERFLETL